MRYLLLALIFLTSCDKCPEDKKLSLVLDWLPNPNHIPLYVGQERGFFAQEGVDLQIVKATDVVNGVLYTLSGRSDMAITYMQTAILAQEKGLPFQIVGKLIDSTLNGLIFVQDGTIKEPKDLSGKRFGYSVDGMSDRLPEILKANHIEPASQHNCHFDLSGMLLSGQVDVLYGAYWNIEMVQLEHKGLSVGHFTLQELGVPNYHELIIVAKEGRDFTPFQRALQKSINYCKAHPEEALALYFSAQPDKGEETRAWERRAFDVTRPLLPECQAVDETLWSAYKNWLFAKS